MNDFLPQTLHSHSSLGSLFSAVATLYTLLLLYSPPPVFTHSPTILTTSILLLCLLRHGASQESSQPLVSNPIVRDRRRTTAPAAPDVHAVEEPDPDPVCPDSFLEWDVRAPLEVIYEECEEDADGKVGDRATDAIRRYASLSLCYPESDGGDSISSEDDEDGCSPEKACFRWEWEEEEEDEEREGGLIEIALNRKGNGGEVTDEENLIEIDLFQAR